MPGSPKKRKTKWKAMDSDLKAPEGQEGVVKRARAQAGSTTNQVDESQHPRRSGHPGAGKGGRDTQLEKIGAILHAPTQTNQAKGNTSLDPNIPANPLAPEPPRKGRGSRSKKKQPPPPYSPSETLDVVTSKSCSKNKTPVSLAPSSESFNSQPAFAPCEAGGRYGFLPPIASIVPPGTEPNINALNNAIMANARRLHALSTPDTSQSQTPIGTSNLSQSQARVSETHHPITAPRTKDPVPSKTTSTTAMLSNTNFYDNLDPALRLSAPPNPDSEESSMSKDGDSSSSDEGGEDEQISWGEVRFSREELPSQSQVATALPTNFEFQHSHDKDDQVAERVLAVDGDLSESSAATDQESAPQPDDVLRAHHERNGYPRLPDPALLELLRSAENRKLKLNAENTSDDEGPKASQLGWYSSRWKSFLEDVKGECRTQQALENPFPSLVVDMPVSITECLSASLVQWLKTSHQVDAGVWPKHKPDMARLLYDDLATWRSELKKIVIAIAPSAYGLVPPADIPIQEHAAWVEAAAADLLDDGKFLRYGLDNLGKTRNFAHPAFFEAIILFMYTRTYCIARRQPDIFRKQVPLKCLALICTAFHCILQGLAKHGNGKLYPKFTAKEYKTVYMAMLGLLKNIKNNPYHGPKLMHQLHEWAQVGWVEASKHDSINTSKHHNLRVQLD
ncbi:uncharacterized protein F5147DRAFT_778236 [Suillus discolor]|uniref:DUF6532 domain-containing protein n=1 Tax=Suillus discolor TaxID=1912936 RepID=A0A9P7EZK7_9AGAM|nr:uncharacterized protein F5147DRAFT_778236 [Suillus discolor]KAG2096727.1 hypothetical protein F5147DRAFT_778236 [Suillus discolor]